jgi:uncharacterized cupredoxin-like copper-binding protein
MVFSQESVPCGTVTFQVTNAGTIVHAFEIRTPDDPGRVAGHTPPLQPGQSATLTVRFAVKGRADYSCSEYEHDERYGEIGYLAIV